MTDQEIAARREARNREWRKIKRLLRAGNPVIRVTLPCFGYGQRLVHAYVLVHEANEDVRSQVQDWLWETYTTEGSRGVFNRVFEDDFNNFPQFNQGEGFILFSIKR